MTTGLLKQQRDTSFSVARCFALAKEVLAQPCVGVLPRIEPRGAFVSRFFLPLELCSPENRNSHGRAWSHAARKDKLWLVMRAQCPLVRSSPLPGRPFIRRIRFSSSEPDEPENGFKTPIDFLCVPRLPKKPDGRLKRGLGFLVDDAPKFVERAAGFWERVPPGKGFGLLEIYTGAPT